MTDLGPVVPLRFDLSDLVRKSVATLYSHLVTRPTGQALRLGIESQIEELGAFCLTVLDFSEVVVLDYSCAEETVAKLVGRFQREDRPVEAFFIVRGIDDRHRETIDAVLGRQKLAIAAEPSDGDPTVLGEISPASTAAIASSRRATPRATSDSVSDGVSAPNARTRWSRNLSSRQNARGAQLPLANLPALRYRSLAYCK